MRKNTRPSFFQALVPLKFNSLWVEPGRIGRRTNQGGFFYGSSINEATFGGRGAFWASNKKMEPQNG